MAILELIWFRLARRCSFRNCLLIPKGSLNALTPDFVGRFRAIAWKILQRFDRIKSGRRLRCKPWHWPPAAGPWPQRPRPEPRPADARPPTLAVHAKLR